MKCTRCKCLIHTCAQAEVQDGDEVLSGVHLPFVCAPCFEIASEYMGRLKARVRQAVDAGVDRAMAWRIAEIAEGPPP